MQGGLIETNMVIFGSGTAVTLLDPTTTSLLDQANSSLRQSTPAPTATATPTPTPMPPPPPSKYGKPETITAPDPYVIDGGTVINTDYTITTNGVTNYGKIYRGTGSDSSLSAWLFGTTSLFDKQIGFDQLAILGFTPISTFKFSSLILAGAPQIIIGKNQPTSLALISVGDISTGFSSGPLTFPGINSLLLATQDGSITLGSGISFENIPNLAIYARGAGSNLTLDSSILGSFNLAFAAQNDILASNSLVISETGTAPLGNSLNLILNAGRDITINNNLELTTQVSQVDNGGNITITAGRNLSVGGESVGGLVQLDLINSDGGSIGTGGTISINVPTGTFSAASDVDLHLWNQTGGSIEDTGTIFGNISNLSAGSLFDAAILNEGGSLGTGANLDFTFGTASVTGEASFRIQNEDLGFGGGNIGGNASINVSCAGSFNAGLIFAQINNLGGSISGQSSITFGAGTELKSFHDATFEILQNAPNGNSSITIDSAGSISISGSLIAKIANSQNSFDIDNVSVGATNDITIGNQLLVDGNVSAGGSITATNGINVAGNLNTTSGDITSSNGNIVVGGIIATLGAGRSPLVMSQGSITAQSIVTNTLQTVAGNVTINNQAGNAGLVANTIMLGGNLLMVNSATISPNPGSADGTTGETPFDFNLTAGQIISTGPIYPGLFANASSTPTTINPGNGGNITLNLNTLTIGSTSDLTSITANGGAFVNGSTTGGNGGTINLTATGDLTVGGDITATTGAFSGSTGILGTGGTVSLTTSGAITVNSKIEVSSADLEGPVIRRSAKGGNINLTSTRNAGPAITVNNSGQLLALLDAAAPGPGGKITFLASGNGGSSVNVNGTLTASKGTIDIQHTGTNGTVNISDASGTNNAILHADVIKIGALGTNGLLTIGRGVLSANDTLKLYGGNTNGEVRFVDNVTIGGQNFTIIAANAVTINNGKVVTVTGAPADVYTAFTNGLPNANYHGFGGNNHTTGTFAGAGANHPQPIQNAPPFNSPPGG